MKLMDSQRDKTYQHLGVILPRVINNVPELFIYNFLGQHSAVAQCKTVVYHATFENLQTTDKY